jgi:hypothetical protein
MSVRQNPFLAAICQEKPDRLKCYLRGPGCRSLIKIERWASIRNNRCEPPEQ